MQVFGVVAIATAAQAQSTSTTLPTIDVQSVAESGTGPVEGYQARQSVTSTKTDTPLLETPQSISVVPKDQIQDQQAQSMPQALRYTPGVSLDAYSSNSRFDPVYVRGFLAEQFLDGLKLPVDPGTQWAAPRIEPYNLERIEVLKGPSSGLYGQTNPGGFINMVSKRPKDTPHYEFEGQYGSFDRFQGAFDIGGPADKNGQFMYRLVGLARDANSQIDYQQDNKLFIAPSFTWRPTLDTSLTFLSSYHQIDNNGYQQYVPGQGTLLPNPNGKIPYSRYLGEPGVDKVHDEQAMFGYAFEHRLNSVFQFRQNFRYTKISTNTTAFRSEGLQADLRSLNRSMNYVLSSTHNVALDNQLQADFVTGPLKHKLLFGSDYLYMKGASDYRTAGIAAIDVFNPVYGAAIPSFDSLSPFIRTDAEQRQLGVYVQDQIKVDRFTVSLTGRQDRAKNDLKSFAIYPTAGTYHSDDSAFTGRVGVNYLFDFGLSPYANYSTSFMPVSGASRLGEPFKPTEGEGWEAGVKYQPNGMNLLLTAGYFDFTQQNVLTTDPVNPLFSVQTGEVRVTGFEFEARGNLTRELSIIASYGNIDPRVTQSNSGTVGKYVPNVALSQAALWAKYDWLGGSLAGLGVGAGVRYVGKLYGNGTNTIEVDPYTLVDAMVSYDFGYLRPDMKGWKAQLNASNLFDKTYVTNCFGGLAYCAYGQGRTVMLTLKYAWQPSGKTVQ
ncbi:MAG: TonB-dependent siderophore receptor [Xanthobacteraceae bacterium]|uniref:TonB-dependent siderophore receptor n=1 Tax=Pseudolabrys sp. TaxID=1960880 RepID=UPI003D11BC39